VAIQSDYQFSSENGIHAWRWIEVIKGRTCWNKSNEFDQSVPKYNFEKRLYFLSASIAANRLWLVCSRCRSIKYFPPLPIEKFDLQMEQWASCVSLRHSCKNDVYFKILIHSLLNLQYRLNFDEEFLFLNLSTGNTDVELESFDTDAVGEQSVSLETSSSPMSSTSDWMALSMLIGSMIEIYREDSIFWNHQEK
jgi:hypothetical protein